MIGFEGFRVVIAASAGLIPSAIPSISSIDALAMSIPLSTVFAILARALRHRPWIQATLSIVSPTLSRQSPTSSIVLTNSSIALLISLMVRSDALATRSGRSVSEDKLTSLSVPSVVLFSGRNGGMPKWNLIFEIEIENFVMMCMCVNGNEK